MSREEILREIIQRVDRLNPEQLRALARWLDRLPDLTENPAPAPAPDQKETGSD